MDATQVRQRAQRADALPERTMYADKGCNLHSRCLTCPFEVCQFDIERRKAVPAQHRAEIVRLRGQGLTVDDVARQVGLSKRRVYTILRQERAAIAT